MTLLEQARLELAERSSYRKIRTISDTVLEILNREDVQELIIGLRNDGEGYKVITRTLNEYFEIFNDRVSELDICDLLGIKHPLSPENYSPMLDKLSFRQGCIIIEIKCK